MEKADRPFGIEPKMERHGVFVLEKTTRGEYFLYREGFSTILDLANWNQGLEMIRLNWRPIK